MLVARFGLLRVRVKMLSSLERPLKGSVVMTLNL